MDVLSTFKNQFRDEIHKRRKRSTPCCTGRSQELMETGAKITTEELMRFLNVNIDDPDAEINIEIARLMTLEAVLPLCK